MQLTVILFCTFFAATRAIGNRYEEALVRHLRTERIPNSHEAKPHTNLRSISCTSPLALGMENNNIPNSAITASSWLGDQRDFYGPQLARLNVYPLGPWIKRDDDTASWIQVDLGDEFSGTVTGLQTQGAGESASSEKYVSAFKVRYGEVRCNLNYVVDSNGATKVFTATSSAVTTHTFSQSVQARIIRIEPTTCKEYCALRFELFGCIARTSCGSGWNDHHDTCYFLNHDARVNFAQAKSACQSTYGGKIASIHSKDEQSFIGGEPECYTESFFGADYRGSVSVTKDGTTCLIWSPQTPNGYTPENHPTSGLNENYCRNPDADDGGPWCYTALSGTWGHCDVGTAKQFCHTALVKQDPTNDNHGYFVGLSDQTTEGVFQWADGSPVDYTNWHSDEPDNSGGDQDCVALWPKGGSTWRDYDCNTRFPYVCEKPHELSLLGRSATQSSTNLGSADRAIDGSTNAVFSGNSCTQTTAGSGAWWMVDNVFNQCIGTVAIYTRQDCCKEQLQGAIVRVGSNPDRNTNPACGSPITLGQINANPIVEVTCNRRGRYLSVSLPGNEPLTLCEVKAYFGVCSAGLDTSPFTTAVCSSPAALGMENGEIADALITSSSSFDGSTAKYGRLGGRKCWRGHRSESTPWIQVDLFGTASNAVSGLITQGDPEWKDSHVTSYNVQVGEDICSLQYIVGSDNEPTVFTANSDPDTKVTNLFATTLKARYLRIYLTEWTGFPSFRFEVLGCRL